ncbi:helix-turn-helix domain-containing protein [Daejeonella sp. H1SJ63]|uniref:helix-turn-helix domain-containing protein n=1 Tax=Daejeonella sp. H1SJ63 TaxID=3034145 RepID=UPI0023EC54F5|nr:helix-turn-helix domain-containing protein [Daejeonella sp. H1SJ63]
MIFSSQQNNALLIQSVSESEFKEFMTQLFESHLGRKLNDDSKFYFNDQEIAGDRTKDKTTAEKVQYLTRGEVAKHLQISLPTLHNYVKQGFIKSYRIGGKVRFKLKEVDQALTERNFTSVMRKGGNHAA